MPKPLPPHVAAIEPDHVRLAGSLTQLLPRLRGSPFAERVRRDEQLRVCLHVPPQSGPLDNPYLVELLVWLAGEGVAFYEAYDQPYGPGEIMRALQASGAVRGGFQSIIVRGADDWELVAQP